MRISYHDQENPSFQPPSLFPPLQYFFCCQTECIKFCNMTKKNTFLLKPHIAADLPRKRKKKMTFLYKGWWFWFSVDKYLESTLIPICSCFHQQICSEGVGNTFQRIRKLLDARWEEVEEQDCSTLCQTFTPWEVFLAFLYYIILEKKIRYSEQFMWTPCQPLMKLQIRFYTHCLSLALETKNSSHRPKALNHPLIFIPGIYF